jgi:tetratricopeptide (TPR) repeat protein
VTERPLALALAPLAVLVALLALDADLAGAQPQGADRAKAAASFKQGQAYFKNGDFDRALKEYQAAFDLSGEPSLVFNIALCHDRSNRPEQALQAYRRYLELAPSGDVADEAREEVARLARVLDQLAADREAKLAADREAARAAEEARRRERERAIRDQPPPPPSRVPLLVMGAGAAVVAVGATWHVLAWRTRGRVESAPDPGSYFTERDTFKLRRAVAIAGYAAGAVTVATGLILGRTVFRRPERPQLSAAIVPGGAMLAVGWAR